MSTPHTTNNAGIPVESDEHSLTVGPRRSDPAPGPLPDREDGAVQPGTGPGAGGARQGQRRVRLLRGDQRRQPVHQGGPLPARASAPRCWPGSRRSPASRARPDTWRDPRGFALKFYTEHGNYDLVGNNTPVFFVRDPIKFQDFIRSQKRRPDNGLRDNDMQWDFWTLSPESAHQVTWLMGDRGIPKSYRHMNGYGSHTYMWINGAGDAVLGQVPLQDRPGHRLPHRRTRPTSWPGATPTCTAGTCTRRSSAATTRRWTL